MNAQATEEPGFSLVHGGPAYRLEHRLRLRWRIVAMVAASWVPLAIAVAFGPGGGAGAFFTDVAVYTRFLIALPLLVLAESAVDERLGKVLRSFAAGGLLPPAQAGAFGRVLERGRRWRDSPSGTLLCVLVVYGEVTWSLLAPQPGVVIPWAGGPGPGSLSPAGWWFILVSQPLLRFLLVRWLWRVVVWTVLLAGLARLPLALEPTHPDRCGGLAFLGEAHVVFASVVLPIGVNFASRARDRLMSGLATPRALQIDSAVLLAEALIIFLGPLLIFLLPLYRARVKALHTYAALGTRYTADFTRKWMAGPLSDSPLGSQDIQSLADLQGGYEPVSQMKLVLIERKAVVAIALAVLLPMLLLTGFGLPVEDLLARAGAMLKFL